MTRTPKPKRGAYDYLVNDPIAYPGNEEALFPGDPPVPSTNRAMNELARSMLPVDIGPKPPEPSKKPTPTLWVVEAVFWLLLCFAIGLLLGRAGGVDQILGRTGGGEQIRPTAFPPTWYGGNTFPSGRDFQQVRP